MSVCQSKGINSTFKVVPNITLVRVVYELVFLKKILMVLIGLGSNKGDSVGIIKEAMLRLTVFAEGELKESSLWVTSPVDCPADSPDFINAVVGFAPKKNMTPELLLESLKAIERDYGRDPKAIRNAPRALDLDLLIFNDEIRQQTNFVLPHPRAEKRKFVLSPAAEVYPEGVWPGKSETIQELLNGLRSSESVERLIYA